MTSSASTGTERDEASARRAVPPEWAVCFEGVRLVALRALGDAALAEDVAQEAITRAIARIASEPAESIRDLGAFVHGIARHIITDIHRTKGRTTPLEGIAEPAEPRVDALAAIIQTEERDRVRQALNTLSSGDRDVLYLSFYEGLKPDEIAARMKEASELIRKRKSRALERLRRAFFADESR